MSVKDLIAGECGGPNPLMQLAHKVHTGTAHQREIGIARQLELNSTNVEDEAYANQIVPQTIDMQTLLQSMDNACVIAQNKNNELFSKTGADIWKTEYLSNNSTTKQPGVSNELNQKGLDYSHLSINNRLSQQTIMPPSQQSIMPPSQQTIMPPSQQTIMPLSYIPPLLSVQQPPQQTHGTGKWAHEYLDSTEVAHSDVTNKTPQEILDEFDKEEVDRKVDTARVSEEWIREYANTGSEDALEEVEALAAQESVEDAEYWAKLQTDWTEMFRDMQQDTADEFEGGGYERQIEKEYEFEKSNPFAGMGSEAFEKGLRKLEAGDLISAVLLFEEAVTADPQHVEAWQYLGTSQAENEQEMLAIQALNKCLELQPDNLVARMNIAVSYTNEYLQTYAYKSLKLWIQHNPKYSHLLNETVTDTKPKIGSSLMTNPMFQELQDLYFKAARCSPKGDIDADVQIGLGVLYNLSGDYEKAVDCFKAALQAQPGNATLWNKLGATLANGSRSAEAIGAYQNALELRPGFIRCRYNLGISCVNMKSYREAIEHFLCALSMQRQGEDPSRPASTMSESIWSTLRMTVSLLGRVDLMTHLDKRNLEHLVNEFNINGRHLQDTYGSRKSFYDALSRFQQYSGTLTQWYSNIYHGS